MASFEDWRGKRRDETIEQAKARLRVGMMELGQTLIEDGPKWTGASSGEATGRPIPRSHPAHGMQIGNFINGGESGWQYREEDDGTTYAFILSNPMWDYYLRLVEFGFSYSHRAHFILNSWTNFRSKL